MKILQMEELLDASVLRTMPVPYYALSHVCGMDEWMIGIVHKMSVVQQYLPCLYDSGT